MKYWKIVSYNTPDEPTMGSGSYSDTYETDTEKTMEYWSLMQQSILRSWQDYQYQLA